MTTAPRPRTKKPQTIAAVAASDAPHATPIPQPTIALHETVVPDIAAIEAEALALDADYAAQESALRANLRDLAEKRGNAQKATQLLSAQTTRQRQAEQEAATQTARRTQQEAYEADVEIRQRLFAKAQELTTELAGVVKDALQVDGRIYAASLVLGISTQRGGYARRSLESAIGYPLNVAGLLSFPRTRPTPITYRDTLDGGDLAPVADNFPLLHDGGR